jgi:hypothetical protein
MSVFSKLTKIAIDTITSPIEIIKDVVTMGGILTDSNKPYTAKRLNKLGKDLKEFQEEVDDL